MACPGRAKGSPDIASATRRLSMSGSAAAMRSVVVKTPMGSPRSSTTTSDPTAWLRIIRTAFWMVSSGRQTTGGFWTRARNGRARTCCSPASRRSRNAALVLEADIVGLARGRERLPQGRHAALGEERQELEEDLARDERVAQRSVPSDDRDAEPFGDRLEAVVLERRVNHGGQEQRVEHGVREAHAGLGLGELEEAHVERGVVPDEHGVLAEAVEL